VEVALVSESELGRAALRGVVAAMAMTGLRTVTVGLGLLPKPPPVEIATEGVPALFSLVPPALRSEAVELAHWAYGAAAGAAFVALPPSLRCRRWAGPTYGLGTWAFFEAVAPALGMRGPRERSLAERASIIADHLLYGAIVGARR
jgi:hypothetical protein